MIGRTAFSSVVDTEEACSPEDTTRGAVAMSTLSLSLLYGYAASHHPELGR